MTSCGAQKLIEDVARIAAIGIRPEEDVEAPAVVGAQNTHHGVACQLLRGPQPLYRSWFTADGMDQADQINLIRHRRQLATAPRSTGVYWIALYNILQEADFEVYLVNARYTKSLSGRKSDVKESQWLMKLHTYGLLPNSFRPPQQIRWLRGYWRQRHNHVRSAASCIHRMDKVLTEMNVRLSSAVTDLSGAAGLAITQAIVNGERDPQELAAYRDPRVKATEEEIARQLQGNWQEDLLFRLQQELAAYRFWQALIADCDKELAKLLRAFPDRSAGVALPEEKRKNRPKNNYCSLNVPSLNAPESKINFRRRIGDQRKKVPTLTQRMSTLSWFLDRLYVLCLKAFRSFRDIELYCLAFLQAAEAAALNGREMHKYVFATLTADEAVALGIVKPLYCSLFH